eukprot:scaffold421360_cov57-Attheya_sp.AAC.5
MARESESLEWDDDEIGSVASAQSSCRSSLDSSLGNCSSTGGSISVHSNISRARTKAARNRLRKQQQKQEPTASFSSRPMSSQTTPSPSRGSRSVRFSISNDDDDEEEEESCDTQTTNGSRRKLKSKSRRKRPKASVSSAATVTTNMATSWNDDSWSLQNDKSNTMSSIKESLPVKEPSIPSTLTCDPNHDLDEGDASNSSEKRSSSMDPPPPRQKQPLLKSHASNRSSNNSDVSVQSVASSSIHAFQPTKVSLKNHDDGTVGKEESSFESSFDVEQHSHPATPDIPEDCSVLSSSSAMSQAPNDRRRLDHRRPVVYGSARQENENEILSSSQDSFASAMSVLSSSTSSIMRPSRYVATSTDTLSRRSHHHNHSLHSSIRGAGTDAHAVQDAGSYRMLTDDCLYLCGTVLDGISGTKPQLPLHEQEHERQHSGSTANAACDLAMMLSQRKVRSTLWVTTTTTTTHSNSDKRQPNQTTKGGALSAILNVLACAPSLPPISLANQELLGSQPSSDKDATCVFDSPEWKMLLNGGEKSRHQEEINNRNPNTEVESGLRTKSGRKRKGVPQEEGEPETPIRTEHDLAATEALALVAHFLSLDCTKSTHAASSGPSMARQMRKRIMKHDGALKGISRLVLLGDPIVTANLNQTTVQNALTESQSDRKNNDDDRSVASSSVHSEKSIPEGDDDASTSQPTGVAALDPTKRGRKRKKRRRIAFQPMQDSCLDPILEHVDVADDMIDDKAHGRLATNGGDVGGSLSLDFLSQSSTGSLDESNMEWTRRKRQREDDTASEASSTVSLNAKFQLKLDKIKSRIKRKVPDVDDSRLHNTTEDLKSKKTCACCQIYQVSNSIDIGKSNLGFNFPGSLALCALSQIISGREDGDDGISKDEDEEQVVQEEEESDQHSQSSDEENDVDSVDGRSSRMEGEDDPDHSNNPLLVTNRMLRRSGSLPLLARAMAETLVAVMNHGEKCIGCLSHLNRRVIALASIIDGACCLTAENRRVLCRVDKNTEEPAGLLVSSILHLLSTHGGSYRNPDVPLKADSILSDMALTSLRTLTSLTHENSVAGAQLMLEYKTVTGTASSHADILQSHHSGDENRGVAHLLRLLFRMVHMHQKLRSFTHAMDQDKNRYIHHCYDVIIFCLNTLTNLVETSDSQQVIAGLEFVEPEPIIMTSSDVAYTNDFGGGSSKKIHAVKWLSRWLVSQTESYRDAVMKGKFGAKEEPNHRIIDEKAVVSEPEHQRDLEKHEEEFLVTAGNGFILLTCLMRHRGQCYSDAIDEAVQKLRKSVISEMPQQTGVTLMIKTLKAFCNFYHFSIGDLSVAVVEPVMKLIVELEKI